MDLTGVPAEVAPWVAIPASLFLLWKLAGEGFKSWRDAKQVGRAPATAYEILEARLVKLEIADEEKSGRIDDLDAEVLDLRRAVRRLAGVLTREVASVLTWITSGARPPAPHEEIAFIRSVITDLERDQKETP